MERYFVDPGKKKTYKLREIEAGAQLYWVQVYQYEDGSFIHSRGMDRVESFEKGLEVCGLLAKDATEADYIEALKEYFGIDKKIREAFIKNYNL
jgi:hypothetical protein